jgi:hypothetical protein
MLPPFAKGGIGASPWPITSLKISDVESGLTRLCADLADGTWEHRYGHLLCRSELDLGYRLVIAHRGRGGTT